MLKHVTKPLRELKNATKSPKNATKLRKIIKTIPVKTMRPTEGKENKGIFGRPCSVSQSRSQSDGNAYFLQDVWHHPAENPVKNKVF